MYMLQLIFFISVNFCFSFFKKFISIHYHTPKQWKNIQVSVNPKFQTWDLRLYVTCRHFFFVQAFNDLIEVSFRLLLITMT